MLARPAPPQRLDIVFLCANLALLATPPAGFRTSAEVGERVDCLVLASGTAASLLPLLLAPIRALKMVCLWPPEPGKLQAREPHSSGGGRRLLRDVGQARRRLQRVVQQHQGVLGQRAAHAECAPHLRAPITHVTRQSECKRD
jgi:hypothetical protein